MSIDNIKNIIESGETALGIEFGSTRIKAVLTDYSGSVLAVGIHDWENSYKDGVWTYSQEEIHEGLRSCYSSLRAEVEEKYGVTIRRIGAMGISAMMHGYLAFDKDGSLLTPFQTWRNTNTGEAADELTALFNFNIPLRWTVAHIYQRVLDKAPYIDKIDYVTTLDSYIHRLLTGERVTGIGDASGIFPIDSEKLDYNEKMLADMDKLLESKGVLWKLRDILPKVLVAGDKAGTLTAEGAALLDESGNLEPGTPLCPPEGDAGTGMIATNSVAPGTGNVSAGTSTFAMLVMKRGLSKVYREIDMVTTPDGYAVAMSHANNGTSDLNAWVGLFKEFAALTGNDIDMGEVFSKLYNHSLEGDKDCGGVMAYGYLSGEGVTHIDEGRPLVIRTPESTFNLANFMRANLYTSLGAVKLGLDILLKDEGMECTRMTGHGGFFKTKGVGQRYLAAAVNAPVTVMENAGEGGPWGMAILAAYMKRCMEGEDWMSLGDYLDSVIFTDVSSTTMNPDPEDVVGMDRFMESYRACLPVEKLAAECMK